MADRGYWATFAKSFAERPAPVRVVPVTTERAPDLQAIALRMNEIARELRYAATHTPWNPTPEVIQLCKTLADRHDADAEIVGAPGSGDRKP